MLQIPPKFGIMLWYRSSKENSLTENTFEDMAISTLQNWREKSSEEENGKAIIIA